MTFDEIVADAMDRLGLSSPEAEARVGRAVNRHHRRVTATLGLIVSREAETSAPSTEGDAEVTFAGVEKIIRVWHYAEGTRRNLEEVTKSQLRDAGDPVTGIPTQYAVTAVTSNTVTITLNALPASVYDVYADAYLSLGTLANDLEPAFAESFHDCIIEYVLADELRKQEKLALALKAEATAQKVLDDLRMFLATSSLRVRQGETARSTSARSGGGSGGGSASSSSLTFLQAGSGAALRSIQSKLREIVSPSDFSGADFGAQLAAAIASLPSTGGVVDARGITGAQTSAANPFAATLTTNKPVTVLLGQVQISTDVTWVIPQKCQVVGVSRGGVVGTTIQASDDFVSTHDNTAGNARHAVIVLGETSPYTHGCWIENLCVDARAIADICVYSEFINELSGVNRVYMTDPLTHGVYIEHTALTGGTGSPQNYLIDHLELIIADGDVPNTCVGLEIDGHTASHRGVEAISINGSGAASGAGLLVGMRLNGAPGFYSRIHVESCVDAILVGDASATAGVMIAAVDATDCTNVVRFANTAGVQSNGVMSSIKQNSTNLVKDDVNSFTLTDSSVGLYVQGGGTAGSGGVLSTMRLTRQQLQTRSFELSGETASATVLKFLDGATAQWAVQRSANNTDWQVRDMVGALTRFALDRSVGYSNLGSGTGGAAVRINSITDQGTGGLEVWSGGGSPSKVATIDGSGHVFLPNLPTSDPHVVGELWSNSGVVTVSAG